MPSAFAAGKVELFADVVELANEAGRLEGVELRLEDSGSASISISRVIFGSLEFLDIHGECASFSLDYEQLQCLGTVQFASEDRIAAISDWDLRYFIDTGKMETSGNVRIAEFGEAQFAALLTEDGLTAQVSLSADISPLVSGLVEEFTWYGGKVTADMKVEVPSDGPTSVEGTWQASEISLDSSDGSVATGDLAFGGELNLMLDESTEFESTFSVTGGEALAGSLYLNFANASPTIDVRGEWQDETINLRRVRIRDKGLDVRITAAIPADLATLGSIQIALDEVDLAQVYTDYLKGVLESLGYGTFAMGGNVRGQLSIVDGSVDHATADLRAVTVVDDAARFRLVGLDGLVDFSASGDSADSKVSWHALSAYQAVFGAAEARFYVGGDEFALLQPLALDFFDGGLDISVLAVSGIGEEQPALDFEADIRPVSLAPVTSALGWPEMAGALSGDIPRVTRRGEVIEVGGAIELSVFDGAVTISKLRLERLFGVLPTFAGDITMDGLDLEQLTRTFSFGAMNGTIGGRVTGLRMLDWEPVAFDLSLSTPSKDSRKHRISQRAVDNLSSIGGGPTALLSSTFLRFFEDFGYDELGLSCVLLNNVCSMNGVGPAPNGGYYIVKGSGLPRIDVIGFSRKVDFPQLLRRLEAVTNSGGATIGQ